MVIVMVFLCDMLNVVLMLLMLMVVVDGMSWNGGCSCPISWSIMINKLVNL